LLQISDQIAIAYIEKEICFIKPAPTLWVMGHHFSAVQPKLLLVAVEVHHCTNFQHNFNNGLNMNTEICIASEYQNTSFAIMCGSLCIYIATVIL